MTVTNASFSQGINRTYVSISGTTYALAALVSSHITNRPPGQPGLMAQEEYFLCLRFRDDIRDIAAAGSKGFCEQEQERIWYAVTYRTKEEQ